MTKIYKYKNDIDKDALAKLEKHSSLSIDTEGTGLQIPHRDKLSLIQISTGDNDAYVCQPNRENYESPNLVKILENKKIIKIFHYGRYDISILEFFLKCSINNFFDTKIASRIIRTYSSKHGLADLVFEFCNKKLDKRLGSSDWNKNLDDLTDAQLQYCSNDVIYLHKIKDELYKMLIRENRLELYNSCIDFLKTRIKLDQNGFTEDIFQH
ncbi:MAG: ribonuclease D [Candidatus Pelagibacterales bacterium]|nr:MAG: ribonuclease D [Pelagibacteraceae bacterium TMED233]RZO63274.1 MAG: ribonuclease D [Pelagibacterales bacterium]